MTSILAYSGGSSPARGQAKLFDLDSASAEAPVDSECNPAIGADELEYHAGGESR